MGCVRTARHHLFAVAAARCYFVASMKAYHEYLELHGYFARSGEPRLSRAEFDVADGEFRQLAARVKTLDADERARLGQLKALLYRDRP